MRYLVASSDMVAEIMCCNGTRRRREEKQRANTRSYCLYFVYYGPSLNFGLGVHFCLNFVGENVIFGT